MYKNILIGILAITTVIFMWLTTRQRIEPLADTYDIYNNITIYEDGSYSGQLRNGYNITGCIEKAQCND